VSARPVLVVTGLAREAKLAAGPGVVTIGAGGSASRLRALLGDAPACRGVVSFGIAGGLDRTLEPGTVVIARGVIGARERWPSHVAIVRHWAHRLESRLERVVLAEIAGVDAPVLTPADKRALRLATRAATVDLESHVAAEFAAARDLPFAAIRVVCDPAGRELPSLVGDALRPDGRVDLAAVFRHLVREPGQLKALPRLARDAAAAFTALRRVGAALGPGLGLGGLSLGEPLGDVL